MLLMSKRALIFGRFPGFASLSFRWEQHVDEDEYGLLVEYSILTFDDEKEPEYIHI